ncbi:MAG: class I SAM-dependent methyltransferase [Nanoarchaeota archaeon]|nr:class I SAM-dependent methyltransferase [Nanoarchaeota archaeon]
MDKIIEYFSKFSNEVRDTEKGIFGVSDLEHIKEFFGQVNLLGTFVDLGSGDGRVTILAASWAQETGNDVNAIGIEFDEELVERSKKHAAKLETDVTFLCQDYEDYDFSKVDVLFSYADHAFSEPFVEKLKKEFKGTLYIYEGVHFPEGLKKGKIIWVDQTPIIPYTVDTDMEEKPKEEKKLRGKHAVINSRFTLKK